MHIPSVLHLQLHILVMASKLHILRSLYGKPILQQPLTVCQQHFSKRFRSESLKRKYEQFQFDDGVPVYLKGGIKDKFLFFSTVFLCGVGLVDGAYCLITMALPKKQ